MKKRNRQRQLGQVFSVVGGFLVIGVVLLLHVWLPVQAERSALELRRWDKKLSEEKSILKQLSREFLNQTSLTELDGWAKKNGPWRAPKKKDIITIYE